VSKRIQTTLFIFTQTEYRRVCKQSAYCD